MGLKRIFDNFFEGKKVLVTGNTGFIGSWLSLWLIELGADVIGYALPPYTLRDNFVVTNLEKKIHHNIGDIRDYPHLKEVFKDNNPEIVFHLAAQPLVRKSYEIPKDTYDINVGGTVNVLEAFRKNNTSKILLNMTSDKCYKNQESINGYTEQDRLEGYDPYSSSKACSELVTYAYNSSFFNKESSKNFKTISSLRCGNIIGGGDWQEDRLVPDCMKAIINKEKISIRNPDSIRPWQFVLEPIRGYLMLAVKMLTESTKYSGAWNFGPDNDKKCSVKQIIKRIINYSKKGEFEVVIPPNSKKLHETNTLSLNCSKSKELLHWNPVLNIDDMIEFTCNWYLEENVGYDFDVKQLNNYIDKIIQ